MQIAGIETEPAVAGAILFAMTRAKDHSRVEIVDTLCNHTNISTSNTDPQMQLFSERCGEAAFLISDLDDETYVDVMEAFKELLEEHIKPEGQNHE